MSYGANESSVRGASPVELYRFVIQASEYLYTSQEDDVQAAEGEYLAIPIQRSELEFQGEVTKSNLQISMARNEGIAREFIVQPPPTPVLLYVYRYHESDGPGSKVTIWSGRIIDVTWRNNKATMNCESTYTSLNRQGLKRTYGASCPYTLYLDSCGVSSLAYQLNTTVDVLTGNVITSDDFANEVDGYYAGGYIQFNRPGEPSDFRPVVSHAGNTITIGYSIPGMGVGSDISVYPGCAHNLSHCFNKFNNGARYGGFPYNPLVNPFNGTTLF